MADKTAHHVNINHQLSAWLETVNLLHFMLDTVYGSVLKQVGNVTSSNVTTVERDLDLEKKTRGVDISC